MTMMPSFLDNNDGFEKRCYKCKEGLSLDSAVKRRMKFNFGLGLFILLENFIHYLLLCNFLLLITSLSLFLSNDIKV